MKEQHQEVYMYQPLQLSMNILEEKTRHTTMPWTKLKVQQLPKSLLIEQEITKQQSFFKTWAQQWAQIPLRIN